MNKSRFLKGFSRNIIIVGFVSLFTDLSSQMVFPLIPLYLVSIGASALIIGIVEGAAESTASLLKVFSGHWSDKIEKRKPFIFAGYGISSITKPLFGFAKIWPFVLIVRIVERVGKGIRNAPRDAIIAESCDPSVRGKSYSFHRAMDGIGSVSGALLALFLFPIFGYQKIFFIAFLPGIVAVLVILLIKENKHQICNNTKKHDPFFTSIKKLPKNLLLYIFAASIFALGHFGYAFLLLKSRTIGLSDQVSISLYVFFYIIYTILIIPAGILSDKVGRKPILLIGYFMFGLTSFGLIFTKDLSILIIVFVLYGIFFAMIDGVQRAFVVDLTRRS